MGKILVCKNCKKEFSYLSGKTGRLYCSRDCYKEFMHEKQAKICKFCAEKFYTRSDRKVFCSSDCRIKSMKRNLFHVNCVSCKKDISLYLSEFLTKKKHFCSSRCHRDWKIKNLVGEDNPNYKGGLVEKFCIECGGKYEVPASRDVSKFCSQSCFGTFLVKNKEFAAGRFRAGRRIDLGNIFFRSRWEANFARVLNYLNVKWEYEVKTFRFKYRGRMVSYIPDFYLPDFNCYVEVKGYLDRRSKLKLLLMNDNYPDVELFLIDKKDYGVIKSDYGLKVDNWEWETKKEQIKNLIYEELEKEKFISPFAYKKLFHRTIDVDKMPKVITNFFEKADKQDKIPLLAFADEINVESCYVVMKYKDLKNMKRII